MQVGFKRLLRRPYSCFRKQASGLLAMTLDKLSDLSSSNRTLIVIHKKEGNMRSRSKFATLKLGRFFLTSILLKAILKTNHDERSTKGVSPAAMPLFFIVLNTPIFLFARSKKLYQLRIFSKVTNIYIGLELAIFQACLSALGIQ